MPTKILYYDSNELLDFDANVLSCVPKAGYYEIILDQTAFFPEIGGMQCDQGLIGAAHIDKVIKRDNDIIHLSKDNVAVGAVQCQIDKEKRFTNIQAHDAQHLISAIMKLDYGLETVSHHTFDTHYDLVLTGKELNETIMKECEQKANKLILKHARMVIETLSKDEYIARGLPYNEKYGNAIRLTNIEYLNENNACGCLHFDNMDKLMLVNLLSFETVKKQFRIIFTAGLKLNELLHHYYALFNKIKLPLKANDDNIFDKINDLIVKNHEQNLVIRELKTKIYTKDIDELLRKENHIVYYDDTLNYEELKLIANIIINHPNPEALAFLQLKHNDKYQFIMAKAKGNATNLNTIFTKLKANYPLTGGGSGLTLNGQADIDLSEIIKQYF